MHVICKQCGFTRETVIITAGLSYLLPQVKFLKRSVETAVDRYKQSVADSGNTQDISELSEQNMKLKAMLSTKREQIATLRSVLKANKSTAEVALANLKQKYETEKVNYTILFITVQN